MSERGEGFLRFFLLNRATFFIMNEKKGKFMGKDKQLIKNTLILAIGMVLPKIFTVLTIPIYSSYLNVEEFGGVDYVTTIILGLVVPVLTLQLENGVFRYLIDAKNEEQKKRYISTGYFLVLLLSLISMVVMYFIPINGLNTPMLRIVLSVYVGIETLILFFRNVVRGLGKNAQYALNSIISVVVNFIMMVITMMVLKAGVDGYMLSLLVPDIVALAYLIWHEKLHRYIRLRYFDQEYLGKLLRYSLPLIPNAISWFVINFSDKVIIVAILGQAAQGIYATAYKIPNMFNMFYQAFNLAWTESASRNANKSGQEKYYSRMFAQLFKLLSGGVLLLIAFSPFVFKVLVRGASYFEAINYMPLLIVSTYLSCIAAFYGSVYVVCKESKKAGVTSFIAAAVNLVVHFALITWLGLHAAVISTFVSFLVLTLYRAYDINKHYYRIKYNYRLIIFVAIMTILQVCLYYVDNLYVMLLNMLLSVIVAWFINQKLIKQILRKLIHR